MTAGTASATSFAATGPPPDTRWPARPWTWAASAPATGADRPAARRAPAIPASTSPEPAEASHAGPSAWLYVGPSGGTIRVVDPLISTVASIRTANARA